MQFTHSSAGCIHLLTGRNGTSYCQNKLFKNHVRLHPVSRKHIQRAFSSVRDFLNLWFLNLWGLLSSCFLGFWISCSLCQHLSTPWWLSLWWGFCCSIFQPVTSPVSASALHTLSHGMHRWTAWQWAFCGVWGVIFTKKISQSKNTLKVQTKPIL